MVLDGRRERQVGMVIMNNYKVGSGAEDRFFLYLAGGTMVTVAFD
jgi:hypothetical protein